MSRYEYKVIDTGKHVEEELNALGAGGWQRSAPLAPREATPGRRATPSRRRRSRARPGRNGLNASTKRNAGAATSGCGRLEKMLHHAAERTLAPRGTRDEADREPLRNAVDGDRDRDGDPELRDAAIGDAHADALAERKHGHHGDDQQALARIGAA
jgi:hypothetical protein